MDPALDVEKAKRQAQKWNRFSYVLNNPLKYIDESGMEENLVGGGIVVNKSSQDIYIAFDADKLNSDGSNLDVVIPLHPGENSEKYTFDADAVVIGEGQTIGGATKGSFKISAGSVVVKDGKEGNLDLVGSATYFAMKNRKDPEQRSGYQSEAKTPQQWKVSGDRQRAEQQRQKTAATKTQRFWNRVKSTFQISRP